MTEDELQLAYEKLFRLRASHDRLLEAAKATVRDANELCLLEYKWLPALEAAVATAADQWRAGIDEALK